MYPFENNKSSFIKKFLHICNVRVSTIIICFSSLQAIKQLLKAKISAIADFSSSLLNYLNVSTIPPVKVDHIFIEPFSSPV